MKNLEKEPYDYAEKMGFLIVGSSRYIGSGLRMNRPGIHKIMKAADGRKRNILLAKAYNVSCSLCKQKEVEVIEAHAHLP